ncbi:MAG: SEC-C domain-containing protein, partial [bacterium]|nr:SEC-C domain-containing protein [bacterium]
MKLKRNDPCWCGSGKKYKKCHLNQEVTEPPSLNKLIQYSKKVFNKKVCLHPNAEKTCLKNIVRAHTVQKSGGLSHIAECGKVLQFVPSVASLYKGNTGIIPSKIGIKTASTINGFCNKHDNEIFRPIDTNEFIPCLEHAFLVGYRSLCRDLYYKQAQVNEAPNLRAMNQQEYFQEYMNDFEYNNHIGLNELKEKKKRYDEILINR